MKSIQSVRPPDSKLFPPHLHHLPSGWKQKNFFRKKELKFQNAIFPITETSSQIPSREEWWIRSKTEAWGHYVSFSFNNNCLNAGWERREMKREPVLKNYCLNKWQAWHILDDFLWQPEDVPWVFNLELDVVAKRWKTQHNPDSRIKIQEGDKPFHQPCSMPTPKDNNAAKTIFFSE